MKNELMIFENPEFGKVRVIEQNGVPWFVGKDAAEILGYKNTRVALQDNVDEEDKGVTKVTTSGGAQEAVIINESGLYALIFGSKLENAKSFRRWVTSEVLPTLRQTGTYKIEAGGEDEKAKRAEAMLINAKARAAKLYLQMADIATESSQYKNILVAKAAETLSGEIILPLPKRERKTYSAKDIGEMLGISAAMVGRIANANGLKTSEYGETYRSKSEYSNKEVDTWRYYDTAIGRFESLIGKASE